MGLGGQELCPTVIFRALYLHLIWQLCGLRVQLVVCSGTWLWRSLSFT